MDPESRCRMTALVGILAAICSLPLGCASPDSPDSQWTPFFGIESYSPPVASIAFSPDGTQIATSHTPLYPSDWRPSPAHCCGYLKLWDAGGSRNQVSILIDGLTLQSISFSADGKQVLAPVKEHIVAWNIERAQLIHSQPARSHSVSPDGRLAARRSREDDHCIVVETIEDQELQAKISIPDSDLYAIGFSSDGRLLALRNNVAKGVEIIIWNLEADSEQCDLHLPAEVKWRGVFSADNSQFSAMCFDNIVRVWNTESGSLEKRFKLGTRDVWSIAFSPDGNYLAVGYEAGESEEVGGVVVWNVATGEQVAEIPEESAWGTTAVAFSPDGRLLAAGNSDGAIHFWQVPTE